VATDMPCSASMMAFSRGVPGSRDSKANEWLEEGYGQETGAGQPDQAAQ
jgi:hypothetical protein